MKKHLLTATLVALVIGTTGVAQAQTAEAENQALVAGDRQPVEFSQRPLTIPRDTIRVDGDFALLGLTFDLGSGSETNIATQLALGGAYGITDDFEAGAVLLPLTLSPDFEFGRISLYGMYRLTQGDFEVGARATFSLPTNGEATGLTPPGLPSVNGDLRINIAAPMLIRFGTGRLDIAPSVDIVVGEDIAAEVNVPIDFTLSLSETFFAGLRTGALLNFGGDDVVIRVPLGLRGGITLPGADGPMLDIYGSFGFPAFLTVASETNVITEIWQVGVGADFYLYL